MSLAWWTRKIDYWMFESYRATSKDLAVYRILFALCAIFTRIPSAGWLHYTPHAFFSPPPSLAALSTSLPPESLIIGLNVLLALSLQMLLLGYRTRLASLSTGFLLLTINSFGYTIGHINHDILIALTPLIMAFSGWGRVYSLDTIGRADADADTARGSWCLALLALVIGIAMFTAGWVKLTTGWLDPHIHSAMGHLLINYAVIGRHTWLAELLLQSNSFWLWESADWVVTSMELWFLVAAFNPRWMRFTLAVACVFHLGVWLMYDIVFMPNVVAYGAFVSYTSLPFFGPVAEFVRRRFRMAWQTSVAVAMIGLAAMVAAALLTGKQMGAIAPIPVDRAVVMLGMVFGCGYVVARLLPLDGPRLQPALLKNSSKEIRRDPALVGLAHAPTLVQTVRQTV